MCAIVTDRLHIDRLEAAGGCHAHPGGVFLLTCGKRLAP
jgi:hypothetical protein